MFAWLRVLRKGRQRFEDGLEEEIQFHLEQRANDLAGTRGLSHEEALRQARLEFGGQETVREECRRSAGLAWIDGLRQDVRYAVRVLVRKPVFALVAIGTLAVGIGGNAAMFSVLDEVVLKTLPVRSPEELFLVRDESRIGKSWRYSWDFVRKLQNALPQGSQAAAMTRANGMRLNQDRPATVQMISGNWFDVLGVRPAAGRLIGEEDNRAEGAHVVAVVSAALWRQLWGDAPFEPGREVRVNGFPLQVIGVAPAGFRGVLLERAVDVWVPLMMQHQLGYKNNFSASSARIDQPWPAQPNIRWLEVMVRAPGGARPVEAVLNSGLNLEVLAAATEETQKTVRLWLDRFSRGHSDVRKNFGEPIWALMVTVGLVLLLVCANIANLLLARASERRREIAVRLAMGAGRWRVIRQMMTESLLLALCGAGLGLLLARLATEYLAGAAKHVGAAGLDLSLDWRVLAFTTVAATASALLFGLLPSVRATTSDPALALKSGMREMHGGSRMGLAGMLVAGQVALSVLLVSGAALFLSSLRNLATLNPGLEVSNLVLVTLDFNKDLQGPALGQYLNALQERVGQVPGVRGAAAGVCPLVTSCTNTTTDYRPAGYVPAAGESVELQTEAVTPGYFSTARTRLVTGREFNWRDSLGAPPVAIVNESLARRYFGAADPVGRSLSNPHVQGDVEIVGVVSDARVNGLRTPAVPMLWRPASQMTALSGPTLHVRVDAHRPAQAEALRRVIDDVDPRARVSRVTTVTEQIGLSLWREYLLAGLTGAFGLVALFLACFGLYGVLSHAVARRTSEMGLRLALGAPPRRLLWTTMRESLTAVCLGIAAGIPLAIGAERLVRDLLFGVEHGSTLIPATAAILLLVSAAVAAYVPARRAARVDPVVALRYE